MPSQVPFYKRGKRRLGSHRREGGQVTTEPEIGGIRVQIKECQLPPEAGGGNGQIVFENLLRECNPADT